MYYVAITLIFLTCKYIYIYSSLHVRSLRDPFRILQPNPKQAMLDFG